MLAPEAFDRIADKLEERDFYRRDHQLIYRAIRELAEKSRPYDAVTLGEWFESQGWPNRSPAAPTWSNSPAARRARPTSQPTPTSCATSRCCGS